MAPTDKLYLYMCLLVEIILSILNQLIVILLHMSERNNVFIEYTLFYEKGLHHVRSS
jgi:hypothetical protein